MIRGLPNLRLDGSQGEGYIEPERQRQCRANPANGALACVETCIDLDGHVWRRHPSADAFTCPKCDLTYLGGPTHVVKTETLS